MGILSIGDLLKSRLDEKIQENLILQDITRLHQDTGYLPEWDVERSVADYIEYLRADSSKTDNRPCGGSPP